MKRLAPVIAIIMVLSLAGVSGLWQQYQRFLQTPLIIGDTSSLVLKVERGSSIRAVVEDLERMGVTRFG